jgi:hypothetical protein
MKVKLKNEEFILKYNEIGSDRKYSNKKLEALNSHIENEWQNDSDYQGEIIFSSVSEIYNEFRVLTIKEAKKYFNLNREDLSFLDSSNSYEDYEISNTYVNNEFVFLRLAV